MKDYFSLIKFSHTVFAMPFAVIGFFLAQKQMGTDDFDIYRFVLVIFCMILARSAAMAFNRYIDRGFDAQNPRTKIREIPAGIISERSALVFVILNSILFITCTYFINDLCFYLSPVALAIVLGYSYTKRFTALCHFILGLGLSLAPIGAYLAVRGEFDLIPLLFSLSVLTWVAGFDIIYALQDIDIDRSMNLNSIPVLSGKKNALRLSVFIHVLSAVFIIIPGIMLHAGVFYWAGTAVFISMLIYQHLIVKPDDLSRVNIAFMTTNGIASIAFSLFYLADIFIGF